MLCSSFRFYNNICTQLLTYTTNLCHSFVVWYPPRTTLNPASCSAGWMEGSRWLPRSFEPLLVVGQGRVEEIHIGVVLLLSALEELLRHGPVGLSLLTVLPVKGVEHVLREARVPLLQGHYVLENPLVRVLRGLREPLRRHASSLPTRHLHLSFPLSSRGCRKPPAPYAPTIGRSWASGPPLFVAVVVVVPSRTAGVQTEEGVYVAPVLLQRISPEVEVGLPGVGDGVNPARRSTFRGLPLGLDDAVLLHLPQGPVQGARVHSLKPKSRGPFHELVAVGVPLPQCQQDNRYQPVSRPDLDLALLLLFAQNAHFRQLLIIYAVYIYMFFCQGSTP